MTMIDQTGPIDGVLDQMRAESATVVDAAPSHDPVNHPAHYTGHPSGIECIQVTEWMDFLLGNATKYIWRSVHRPDITDQIIDLEKARWYLERKINQLQATP
jgi:hypothetical protein